MGLQTNTFRISVCHSGTRGCCRNKAGRQISNQWQGATTSCSGQGTRRCLLPAAAAITRRAQGTDTSPCGERSSAFTGQYRMPSRSEGAHVLCLHAAAFSAHPLTIGVTPGHASASAAFGAQRSAASREHRPRGNTRSRTGSRRPKALSETPPCFGKSLASHFYKLGTWPEKKLQKTSSDVVGSGRC